MTQVGPKKDVCNKQIKRQMCLSLATAGSVMISLPGAICLPIVQHIDLCDLFPECLDKESSDKGVLTVHGY